MDDMYGSHLLMVYHGVNHILSALCHSFLFHQYIWFFFRNYFTPFFYPVLGMIGRNGQEF